MEGGLAFALSMGLLAFLLGVIWGAPFVEVLRRLGVGKQIRVELAQGHQKKAGTPTMGGIMIVLPVFLIALGLNLVNVIRTVTGASILVPLLSLIHI